MPFVERMETYGYRQNGGLSFYPLSLTRLCETFMRYDRGKRVRVEKCSIVSQLLKPEILKIRFYNSLRVHMVRRHVKSNRGASMVGTRGTLYAVMMIAKYSKTIPNVFKSWFQGGKMLLNRWVNARCSQGTSLPRRPLA